MAHSNKLEVISRESVGPYFEKKCLIPITDTYRLKTFLDHYYIAPQKFPVGKNNTLYYDTADLKCYQEGKDGVAKRQKLRLRLYQDTGIGDSYSLEFKERVGAAVKKTRLRLKTHDFSDSTSLLKIIGHLGEGDLRSMFKGFRGSFESLFPRIQIIYKRWRYLSPRGDLRLNLDTQISSHLVFPNRSSRLK